MNKYADSKIYMIRDRTNNNCYIGSTFNKLCLRKAIHKYHYKLYTQNRFHYLSSFDIIKNNDYEFVLLESYPCDTKQQMHEREKFYISNHMNCINRYMKNI